MVLMIDNYDSFTYNLVQYLSELGAEVAVYRNDELSIERLAEMSPSHLVISPGPCTPNEAGISMAAIKHFSGRCPVLGVCLGHQSIAQVFGAKVVRARQVMHGKTSSVYHRSEGVFAGLNMPLVATRYHSLVVEKHSLPSCLEMTAWAEDGQGNVDEIMGLRHRSMDVEGVQFHPEAILSAQGRELLNNFLERKA